jgi:hypothetical protein
MPADQYNGAQRPTKTPGDQHQVAVAERSVLTQYRVFSNRRYGFSRLDFLRSEYAKMSNAEQGGTPLPVA